MVIADEGTNSNVDTETVCETTQQTFMQAERERECKILSVFLVKRVCKGGISTDLSTIFDPYFLNPVLLSFWPP